MDKYYDKTEIFAWMPMIGFDREQPDKGVGAFLERTQYVPHGTSVFMFHPDIVHNHQGMTTEVTLPPDNCSYYASPYNEEHVRQPWTNWDLKEVVTQLKARGVEPYLGIMGVYLFDKFHHEWQSDHPELTGHYRTGNHALFVLKRFKDGTYYEDFFADKVCQTVIDYGFTGLHVADNFCPAHSTRYNGDFSFDMVDQFSMYSGIPIPAEIAMPEDDSTEQVNRRGDWIWANHRQQWIEFFAWRWEGFWKKICDRLHAIGRKVFVLAMYCTDPFETYYLLGTDLRRLVKAGVDYLMPNMAANGSSLRQNRPWRYYEQADMMPLTDAFVEGARKLNMLGVKDATEEWDMLHHAPVLLERDINFLPSFHRQTPAGQKRCIDGFNICLADGIYKDEWTWLRERFDIGMGELPVKSLAPTYVWSDHAHYALLPEYIQTRRWSLHKFMYELNKQGGVCNSVVRTEHITKDSGNLFVPNFDLLSEEEKKTIAAYRGGSVICTASAEKDFHPEDYGITPDIYFEDQHTTYKNCAFAFNLPIENKQAILDLLAEDDGSPVIEDPFNAKEIASTLREFMPYQKVSVGFRKACVQLMKQCYTPYFTSDFTVLPAFMADGAIRMMVFNDDLCHYASATITINGHEIDKVKNVSRFPLLPVKFSDDGNFGFAAQHTPNGCKTFRVLVPQGGLAVVDVYLK